ncbi:LysR substrate-binding domain-containing protein [Phreatobacter stygius]|uniref:LysR substrate-binding domain-containing protein n=1 Tax=Phreatobacter stygius TaxID=1940610 RepID=UPI001476E710|nr:LysR substrate-binding domain-containing protein [Phreatobacter stygius]
MELRHLQYFLGVAEAGSLSKASTVLGIAQPALSRAIRQLETEVMAQLFYRHGRGIRLTEEGAQFQATVAPLVRDLLAAKDELRNTASVISGAVSFGMPPSMSAAIGSRLVEVFLERHPQVKLQIIDAFSGYVNEWLVSGRVDMAIINNARRSPYVRMDPLMTVDLFHVARRSMVDRREWDDDTIPFDQLAAAPLILPGRHHGLRRQLDSVAQQRGAELEVLVEIDALEALKDLVRRGIAPTVLPHGTILKEVNDPDLVVRRVVDPDVTTQFMIAYSLQRPATLAMRELARILKAEIHEAIAAGRMIGRI